MKFHEMPSTIKGFVVLDVANTPGDAMQHRTRRVAINLAEVVCIELRTTIPLIAELRMTQTTAEGFRSFFCIVATDPDTPDLDDLAKFTRFVGQMGAVARSGY